MPTTVPSHPRTIGDYVDLLESGAATATSLLKDALGRIRDYGDDAVFIALTAERAEREAKASDARRAAGKLRSPLDGVPVAWKDLFDTQGTTTTAGAKVMADHPPAAKDAAVVEACTQLGMVCVGKTNLSEFAYSGLGLNPHYGTPKNPHNPDTPHVPGGSSSGSAVSVAAGFVPLAVGTDTAGSVRVPASFCGIAGYKSSQDRYDTQGVFPLSQSLDSLGIFAHTIDDIIVMDAAMRGNKAPLPLEPFALSDLSCVVPQSIVFDGIASDVRSAFEATLSHLEQAGVSITSEPFSVFEDVTSLFAKHGTLAVAEAATLHQNLLRSPQADQMDQRIRERMNTAGNFTAQDYIHLQWERARLQTAVGDVLQGRFLLFPTVAMTAPALEPLEASDDLFVTTNLMALRNTMLGSYLGTPGVSLPIGTGANGMPIGMLLSAPFGEDDRLLAATKALETVLK